MFRNQSIYGGTARFDANRWMTEDEIHAVAPSVFAVTKHDSRSERFAPIPTIEIIRGLAKEGFHVVGARQNVARLPGKAEFTKHLLRIRRFAGEQHAVGGTVVEMYLQNANDGTSAYNLDASLFRIQCLNSMAMKLKSLDAVKVYHTGKIDTVMGKVIEGTYRVLDASTQALEAPRVWSDIRLDQDESELFARAAALVRWGNPNEDEAASDAEPAAVTTYSPLGLLAARRSEDKGNDLWSTFNRVQENAIKGGVVGRTMNAEGGVRRATSRPVKAIDTDLKVNKRLFDLADAFAQLKGAASITGADPKALAMAA